MFDSASGGDQKRVGLVVRWPGEGLLLIRNSDKEAADGRRGGAVMSHPPSPTLMARGPMQLQLGTTPSSASL